jgi:hypothetical protein
MVSFIRSLWDRISLVVLFFDYVNAYFYQVRRSRQLV